MGVFDKVKDQAREIKGKVEEKRRRSAGQA